MSSQGPFFGIGAEIYAARVDMTESIAAEILVALHTGRNLGREITSLASSVPARPKPLMMH
jgi:hypothetical protein